jgi:phosphoenolpyruvate carboxylase
MPAAQPARRPARPNARATQPTAPGGPDKDRPLVEDIRLLGRILGDVIREQDGTGAYELVERVRQRWPTG